MLKSIADLTEEDYDEILSGYVCSDEERPLGITSWFNELVNKLKDKINKDERKNVTANTLVLPWLEGGDYILKMPDADINAFVLHENKIVRVPMAKSTPYIVTSKGLKQGIVVYGFIKKDDGSNVLLGNLGYTCSGRKFIIANFKNIVDYYRQGLRD